MDALSDALAALRLSGGVFLEARFTAPWCVRSQVGPEDCAPHLPPPTRLIAYHYVIDGRMTLRIEGEDPIDVRAGQIVMMPRNDPHLLGSCVDMPPTDANALSIEQGAHGLMLMRHGGGGVPMRMVCGYLGSEAGFDLVTASLPSAMVIDIAGAGRNDWVESSFRFAAQELAAGRVGCGTVLGKLSELLFIEALRRYLADLPPEQKGWLAGLRDPAIASALALLHANVDHPWTAEELARETGLSRSVFADRFTSLIGIPPMRYLTQWRMQVAARLLRDEGQGVAQTAFAVGYESEAAFSRAFKRTFGRPPAGFRREPARAA